MLTNRFGSICTGTVVSGCCESVVNRPQQSGVNALVMINPSLNLKVMLAPALASKAICAS